MNRSATNRAGGRAPAPRSERRLRSKLAGAGLAVLAWSGMSLPAGGQELDKLGWLAGHWMQASATEEVQESWLGPRGNVMVATNLTYAAGRGSSFEFLRIGIKDGRIVYFASPGGRPPVEFPATQITGNSIAFENPANAYPQRIIYRREGEVLIARIEGKRGGNDASEEWRFSRAR